MDLTTLLTVVGLFLSVVAGNAAIFGESLYASIAVPNTLSNGGFDKATAEKVFAAELAWYTRLPSILPTPNVSVSSSPSFTMALAKPLQLQDVVLAIQTQIRQDVVSANGAIMQDGGGKGLSMIMVINAPPDPPATLTLSQPDGDPRALLKTAAREAMIIIAPYRVALSDLAGALHYDPDAFEKAEATAKRGLNQPWDFSEQNATELALLQNLLGVLAIRKRDGTEARHRFRLASSIPNAHHHAYGLVRMNEAFLALTERRTADAAIAFAAGNDILGREGRDLLTGRIMVLEALIAWQAGDLARAEKLLRESMDTLGTEIEPHYYLSRMAIDRGDTATAHAELAMAHIAARLDKHYASLAHTILAIDVRTGALDPNAFLPPRPERTGSLPAPHHGTHPATAAAATQPVGPAAPPARPATPITARPAAEPATATQPRAGGNGATPAARPATPAAQPDRGTERPARP